MDKRYPNGTECLRAVVEPGDPLYTDVAYLKKLYRNPEMVREAVRRLAASIRFEEAQRTNVPTKASV